MGFTFKITMQRQLSQLTWMFVIYSVIAVLWFGVFHFGWRPPYLYILLVPLVFDILPAVLLHIQYLRVNKGATFTIDKEHRKVYYQSADEDLAYDFDDIVGLEHVASYGGGAWYSFSEYRYYKITFRDGKVIFITSLMMKDIKVVMEMLLGMKATKKLKALAFVKY